MYNTVYYTYVLFASRRPQRRVLIAGYDARRLGIGAERMSGELWLVILKVSPLHTFHSHSLDTVLVPMGLVRGARQRQATAP